MKNLKFELVINIVLILVSLIWSIYTGNGLYVFFGVLYSIIIFFTFFFARKKYKNFDTKEVIKFAIISILIIIVATIALVALFFTGMQSFMDALKNVG